MSDGAPGRLLNSLLFMRAPLYDGKSYSRSDKQATTWHIRRLLIFKRAATQALAVWTVGFSHEHHKVSLEATTVGEALMRYIH